MKKSFGNNILLTGLLILIIIVIVCFSIVIFYDQYRRNTLMDDYFSLQQKIVLDDIYSDYLNISNKEKGCVILSKQINNTTEYSNELLDQLRKINNFGIIDSDNKIKYTYVLTNIKLWLYINKLENNCDIDSKVVLYFYPEFKGGFSTEKAKKDAETKVFEYKLEELKEKCNYNVIALPYQKEIGIIDQITNDYNVIDSPSIVVSEKVYYDIPLKDPKASFWKEIKCN